MLVEFGSVPRFLTAFAVDRLPFGSQNPFIIYCITRNQSKSMKELLHTGCIVLTFHLARTARGCILMPRKRGRRCIPKEIYGRDGIISKTNVHIRWR